MSPTIIGNYIQLVSMILMTVFGWRGLTSEESNAFGIVISAIGELIGFTVTQWNATKVEDLTPLGGYKR